MIKRNYPPPYIQVTIDETPLTRVKEKQILGIFINEQLSFTPPGKLTTKKYRSKYNILSLYPDLAPSVALQLYKAYIRSRLEYGCIIWVYKVHKEWTTSNKKKNTNSYTIYIKGINNNNTMLIFTDGSAINNPSPTGTRVIIRKNGPTNQLLN